MKKARFFIVLAVLLVLVFMFPEKVSAYESEILTVRYYDVSFGNDGSEDILFHDKTIEFVGEFTSGEKAFIIYSNLIGVEDVRFIPEGTQLISVTVASDTLVLNVSEEILGQGGGAYEEYMAKQFIENARQFGVKYFTLLIDGRIENSAEGKDYNMLEL